MNVFFDFESHGTSTASNSASRGVLKRDIYQNGTLISSAGHRPRAKVMGVKALWLGDVTFGWYYAAGFDWNPTDFSFKYTGNHRADIISNSWGDSDPIWDLSLNIRDDYMSQLADEFSLPHYLGPCLPRDRDGDGGRKRRLRVRNNHFTSSVNTRNHRGGVNQLRVSSSTPCHIG